MQSKFLRSITVIVPRVKISKQANKHQRFRIGKEFARTKITSLRFIVRSYNRQSTNIRNNLDHFERD